MQQLLILFNFFSRYVTSMFKCLELEAYLQCSTGKSDLTYLCVPRSGDTQHFLAYSKPCHGVLSHCRDSMCLVTLWSILTLWCSGYYWFMLLRVCYHFAFTSCKALELFYVVFCNTYFSQNKYILVCVTIHYFIFQEQELTGTIKD